MSKRHQLPEGRSAAVRRIDLTTLAPIVPPRNDLERRLTSYWAAAIGLDEVGINDDFFTLGGTSLEAVIIFDRMRAELGIGLPLSSLYNASTVSQLSDLIKNSAASGSDLETAERNGGLVRISATGGGRPLFVVPGVGGSVAGLGHLGRSLGAEYALYGLESRGLYDDRDPCHDLGEIAADFVSEIRQVEDAAPYRLFGICWGAMVTWEMAQQLIATGEDVELLLLLDPPPISGEGRPPFYPSLQLTVARFMWERLGMYWREAKNLGQGDVSAFVGKRLSMIRDMVSERDLFRGDRSEIRRKKVQVANLAAYRKYKPKPLSVPIRLLFTSDRPDGPGRTGREGWRLLTGRKSPELVVPGSDTGDAVSPQLAPALARVLGAQLG